MSTLTTTPVAPVLPDLDPEIGKQLGDEILLGTARTDKVAKVRGIGGSRGNARQSAQARAWTSGGQVD